MKRETIFVTRTVWATLWLTQNCWEFDSNIAPAKMNFSRNLRIIQYATIPCTVHGQRKILWSYVSALPHPHNNPLYPKRRDGLPFCVNVSRVKHAGNKSKKTFYLQLQNFVAYHLMISTIKLLNFILVRRCLIELQNSNCDLCLWPDPRTRSENHYPR